eukprot:GILK01011402.1.p1 GENE.GILK01011402.1~~GILK01011402.1.p1  ORF type:complete len:327 (-),score=19.26 GILK01011402.1:120-1100(-)
MAFLSDGHTEKLPYPSNDISRKELQLLFPGCNPSCLFDSTMGVKLVDRHQYAVFIHHDYQVIFDDEDAYSHYKLFLTFAQTRGVCGVDKVHLPGSGGVFVLSDSLTFQSFYSETRRLIDAVPIALRETSSTFRPMRVFWFATAKRKDAIRIEQSLNELGFLETIRSAADEPSLSTSGLTSRKSHINSHTDRKYESVDTRLEPAYSRTRVMTEVEKFDTLIALANECTGKLTTSDTAKGTVAAALTVTAGVLLLGPVGFVVGGAVGGAIALLGTRNTKTMCEVLQEMNSTERRLLIHEVQRIVGTRSKMTLKDLTQAMTRLGFNFAS